mgnify:CR=1 FL=1
MAQSKRITIKEIMLFAFLAVSFVLVVANWYDGLNGQEESGSAFIRATPIGFQIDEDAYDQWEDTDESLSPTQHAPQGGQHDSQ